MTPSDLCARVSTMLDRVLVPQHPLSKPGGYASLGEVRRRGHALHERHPMPAPRVLRIASEKCHQPSFFKYAL
jgi:hypothetical protein